MAIRMSGIQSGLDTETLVSALVSGYTLQKDNLVKAQTKLSWKQAAWKSMNTSIYSFYSGKLSSARYSSTYSLKKASVSDSTKAKVTASSSAVNGTQTLEITKLAATGYLTGGVVKGTDGSKISSSSKLTEMTGTSGGKISVTASGKTTDIELTEDMTVSQFVSKLKDAGVNASFDETNQRFFVSAADSGEDNDFSLTSANADGLNALKSLQLYTMDEKTNAAEIAEYKKWASYTADEIDSLVADTYASKKVEYADRAQTYADQYNANKTAADQIEALGIDKLNQVVSDFGAKYGTYATTGDDGTVTYNTDAMEAAGLDVDEFNTAKSDYDTAKGNLKTYDEAQQTMDELKDANKVSIGADGTADAAAGAAASGVTDEVNAENTATEESVRASIEAKVAAAKDMFDTQADGSLTLKDVYKTSASADGSGAVRIAGQDSEIKLNGATYKGTTNTFSINGLTIEATALTDSPITVTTNTDVDGIYDSIKNFLKEYNTLITAMDTAYNADSASGYEPLTSDEKEAMTDDEVEKWETKIKDALLRKDSTLGNASSSMKNIMATSIEINGKTYSLASFGIATQGYFASATNEKGVYHIDGDTDDSVTSGNDDKLRSMIASDPDTVISFFSQLASKVYTDLGNRMASSTTSSAFTIYNDKQMEKEYSTYTTKISDKEDEITTWEDYYYDKFTSMETALASLNSQQSALSGYFS